MQVSTIGIGTYLGQLDEPTDRAYTQAIVAAASAGIRLIDTAINYRHQRSERSVGAALRQLDRDGLVICTKAGFLTPGAVPDFLTPDDVVGGMHSMTPDFLADQIERSRANLGLDAIDVFYLHNPETQLNFVSHGEFESRMRAAFARLEQLVVEGKIRNYGTATWDGYRKPGRLDLDRLLAIAAREAGEQHHFRFIQLPVNLWMPHPGKVLEAARRGGVQVIASASLLQMRQIENLPEELKNLLPGLETDAQRALQFTRSTPGVTAALVGMSKVAHVREAAAVLRVPPADGAEFLRLFRS